MKSTTKEGLDIDDDDKKKKLEECKAEFEPLTKLMKEILGGKTENVIVSCGVLTRHENEFEVDICGTFVYQSSFRP